MNCINNKDIFPPELLDLIQNYTQGKYVYIPKRDENQEKIQSAVNNFDTTIYYKNKKKNIKTIGSFNVDYSLQHIYF